MGHAAAAARHGGPAPAPPAPGADRQTPRSPRPASRLMPNRAAGAHCRSHRRPRRRRCRTRSRPRPALPQARPPGCRSSFPASLARKPNGCIMPDRAVAAKEPAMTRPFEGIRIIDITHVLAGPFAAYQLAVLGAEVIKVEHPDEPDQSRGSGTDRALNRSLMGTSFLTQGSNKRAITLDLKQEGGREVLKRLVAGADVLVENFRPGAFEALGLGYQALNAINPRLRYRSISPFGQDGPRREPTAYH